MFGKKKKNEYEEEVVEEGRDEFDVDYNDDEDFETDFVSLDEDEDEKPKRGGIGKKVGITFGVILAVLVVAYVGMAFYFDSHFMFNTTINGNNFALKSVAQVEKYMEQQEARFLWNMCREMKLKSWQRSRTSFFGLHLCGRSR